uniref:RRM domain-containing protein n=1 Tax=Acrobeloides nanus TaxID=290746 RepID=A0A914BWP3_9BILA
MSSPINGTNGIHSTAATTSAVAAPSEVLVSMPLLQQTGKVVVGPGALKEAQTIGLGLTNLRGYQKEDLERAKRYAMEQSIKHVLLKQQISHQQNQQKVAMYAQALSLMARVYVGSVSFEVREENIRQSFGVYGPIKSINMSYDAITGQHKGFAFVEFEVPEAALLCQDAMNGIFIGGRNLKVGRPSNMPQAQPIMEMIMTEARQYNRVYVASVHPDLSETDLRSVFEAFGEIKKCQLARQVGGRGHRGFGYIEFSTAQACVEAIAGMNGFDLGGQILKVGRCITPPDALTYIVPTGQSSLPSASAVAAAAVTAKIHAQDIVGVSHLSLINSLPSASAVAAAAVTAKIHAQDIVGGPKKASSPGSPSAGTPSESQTGSRDQSPQPQLAIAPPPKDTLPPPSAILPQLTPHNFVPPTTSAVQQEPALPARKSRRGFGAKAHNAPPPTVVQPIRPLSSENAPIALVAPPPPPAEPTKVVQPSPKKDILSRIKIKEKYAPPKPGEKATFAPLPTMVAPKDPSYYQDEDENGGPLAITGPESWQALAIRENTSGSVVAYGKTEKKKPEKDKKKKDKSQRKKKPKGSKSRGPKLNTPQAMQALQKAGAINDQMQAVHSQNDEASLASQEHVEIRGNDARHLLMHKLMRTNRSAVILLKNMVTKEEMDEYLEEELREEATKYGTVNDLVIAPDQDTEEVRIFVKYADSTQADAAIEAFDKRYFAGRQISCTSYDQILFEHEEYTA